MIRVHHTVDWTSSASNTGTWLGGLTTCCLRAWQLHGVWVMQHSTHRSVLFLASSTPMILCALGPLQFAYWFWHYNIIWPIDVCVNCEIHGLVEMRSIPQYQYFILGLMWTGGCLCSMEDLAERCNFSCFLCKHTHRSSNKAPISVGHACGLHCSIFGGCVKTWPYSLVEVLKDMGLKQQLHSNLNSHPQNRVCQRTWLFCYRATAVVWLLEHWFAHGSTEVGRRGMVQINWFPLKVVGGACGKA